MWSDALGRSRGHQDWTSLDLERLAEEIEALGNEQRHAVRSYLRVLLWHVLKWAYQPDHRTISWRTSILNARAEIADRLEDSPSLRPLVPALPLETFAEMCPWPVEQVLEDDFWPEAGESRP